jgi:hypothetical protein
MTIKNSLRSQPDASGHFGSFGGRYVAETLMPLILELEKVYKEAKQDPAFDAEFTELLRFYVGRPNPLYYAGRLTEALRAEAEPGKGAKIYLKREELNHTGAHKINNCVGQALLARRMGKKKVIAETGAGRHGMQDFHGREGCGAAKAQRLPHEAARRGGDPGRVRIADAQGRNERRPAPLGVERPRHFLHHRDSGRAAPLSRTRSRFPVDHRP